MIKDLASKPVWLAAIVIVALILGIVLGMQNSNSGKIRVASQGALAWHLEGNKLRLCIIIRNRSPIEIECSKWH